MRLSDDKYYMLFFLTGLAGIPAVLLFPFFFVFPLLSLAHIDTTEAQLLEIGTKRTSIVEEAFNFDYYFDVDGVRYRGNGAFTDQPNEIEIIQFDTRNPENNSPDLTSRTWIQIGIYSFIAIAFVLLLLVLVTHHLSPKPQPDPEPETRRRGKKKKTSKARPPVTRGPGGDYSKG